MSVNASIRVVLQKQFENRQPNSITHRLPPYLDFSSLWKNRGYTSEIIQALSSF